MDRCEFCGEQTFHLKSRDRWSPDVLASSKSPDYMLRCCHAHQMDPGEISSYVPAHTDTEAMLIARAHVVLQIHRVRDVQL